MSDLISRDKLKKVLVAMVGVYADSDDYCVDFHSVLRMIDRLPTVEEPKWIPVSERLPEKEGYYLVTMMSTDTSEIWVEKCRFFKDEWYEGFLTIITERVARILAWMPLPKPYKENQDE